MWSCSRWKSAGDLRSRASKVSGEGKGSSFLQWGRNEITGSHEIRQQDLTESLVFFPFFFCWSHFPKPMTLPFGNFLLCHKCPPTPTPRTHLAVGSCLEFLCACAVVSCVLTSYLVLSCSPQNPSPTSPLSPSWPMFSAPSSPMPTSSTSSDSSPIRSVAGLRVSFCLPSLLLLLLYFSLMTSVFPLPHSSFFTASSLQFYFFAFTAPQLPSNSRRRNF